MLTPEPVEARGGSRISRGGGGSFGSIRNSGTPSRGSSPSGSISRPSQPSQGRPADQVQSPARQDTVQSGEAEARRQDWQNQTPDQQQNVQDRTEQVEKRQDGTLETTRSSEGTVGKSVKTPVMTGRTGGMKPARTGRIGRMIAMMTTGAATGIHTGGMVDIITAVFRLLIM